jgi:hypothetical protein
MAPRLGREHAEQLPQAWHRHHQIRIGEPLQQGTSGADSVLIAEALRVDEQVAIQGGAHQS